MAAGSSATRTRVQELEGQSALFPENSTSLSPKEEREDTARDFNVKIPFPQNPEQKKVNQNKPKTLCKSEMVKLRREAREKNAFGFFFLSVIILFLKYLIPGLGAISGFDLAFISESSVHCSKRGGGRLPWASLSLFRGSQGL